MVRALATVGILAFVVACGGGAAPAPVAAPSNTPVGPLPDAPTIAGSYSAPHTVMMVCNEGDDGWCEESVEDTMTVTERGNGDRLDVAIELVQTNGHTCTFSGALERDTSSATPRWTHASTDELDGECRLALERGDGELRLSSEGCRYYCGARASLDATFPFPSG